MRSGLFWGRIQYILQLTLWGLSLVLQLHILRVSSRFVVLLELRLLASGHSFLAGNTEHALSFRHVFVRKIRPHIEFIQPLGARNYRSHLSNLFWMIATISSMYIPTFQKNNDIALWAISSALLIPLPRCPATWATPTTHVIRVLYWATRVQLPEYTCVHGKPTSGWRAWYADLRNYQECCYVSVASTTCVPICSFTINRMSAPQNVIGVIAKW